MQGGVYHPAPQGTPNVLSFFLALSTMSVLTNRDNMLGMNKYDMLYLIVHQGPEVNNRPSLALYWD